MKEVEALDKVLDNISSEKLSWAVDQLIKKYDSLGRIPKKEDFDEATRARIKSFLGPWPRALEKAGLKTAKIKNEKIRSKLK